MTPSREAQLRKLDGLDRHQAAELFEEVERLRRDAGALAIPEDGVAPELWLRVGVESVVALRHDAERMERALRNVLALARRDVGKVAPHLADHLVRFCRDGGVVPSILRSTP